MQLPKLKPSTKKQMNKLKIKIAKSISYTVLVITSSYGLRSMLESLDKTFQLSLTAILVLTLIFILSLSEE